MVSMASVKPFGIRSSLLSHSFPQFYACYLLKSVQTPLSTAIYIGSTPCPPRRIRQHNGELAQGARKTRSKRPWVMQLIVHGFPSKLAALQFEWAWQHPHKSRHFRESDGNIFGSRASKTLKKNIIVVRTMISRHPFNTWPLHVKLFTEEAAQCWKAADDALSLPPGFTCSVELEGVDGKSVHIGSGREGPISVDDSEFTSALLAKNNALLATSSDLNCSICHKPVDNYSVDPLNTALCPSSQCAAVSHLDCLSRSFLNEQADSRTIIPRGGHCISCNHYVLWGDVIRGCYRRLTDLESNGQHPDVASDEMFLSDDDLEDTQVRRRRSSVSESPLSVKGKRKAENSPPSSGGESFDFTNIDSSSEDVATPSTMRRRGRPRKHTGASPIVTADVPSLIKKADASPSRTKTGRITTPISLTLRSSSILNDEITLTVKRKLGRPRKSELTSAPDASSLSSPVPSVAAGNDNTLRNWVAPSSLKAHEIPPLKTRRGRPRKSRGSSSLEAPSAPFSKRSGGVQALLVSSKRCAPSTNDGNALTLSARGTDECLSFGNSLLTIGGNILDPINKKHTRQRTEVKRTIVNVCSSSSSSDGESYSREVATSAEDDRDTSCTKDVQAQKNVGQYRTPSRARTNQTKYHVIAPNAKKQLAEVSSGKPSILSSAHDSALPGSMDGHSNDLEEAVSALSL